MCLYHSARAPVRVEGKEVNGYIIDWHISPQARRLPACRCYPCSVLWLAAVRAKAGRARCHPNKADGGG